MKPKRAIIWQFLGTDDAQKICKRYLGDKFSIKLEQITVSFRICPLAEIVAVKNGFKRNNNSGIFH